MFIEINYIEINYKMNNKLRLIFTYYITPDNEISFIHKFHIYLLSKYIHVFDSIDFIILIDDKNNKEAIDNHKSYIIKQLKNDTINFIIEQNNPDLKEGNVYVKYIIDKLNKLKINDLIFYAYTIGLEDVYTNNIENIKIWISYMYFMNFEYMYDVTEKLLDVSRDNFKDYICYGCLYNINHNIEQSKYTWKYIGGYHWVNPKRLIDYINSNNIDIDFVHKIETKNKNSIETFLPNIFDYNHVAFLNDQMYNKNENVLTYNDPNIIYNQILYVLCLRLQYDDYINFINFYNKKDISLYDK